MENVEVLDNQELLVPLELVETPDYQELQAKLEPQAQMEHEVAKEEMETLELKDPLEPLVHLV